MDVDDLRKKTMESRKQILLEKKRLVEQVTRIQEKRAADAVASLFDQARETLPEKVAEAAARGESSIIILQLSTYQYDLRTAVMDYLKSKGATLEQSHPGLFRLGPLTYSQVAELVREAGVEEPAPRHAAPWVHRYQEHLRQAPQRKGLRRMFSRPPEVAEGMAEFLDHCRSHNFEPRLELYHAFDHEGIAVRVEW